MCGYRNSSWYDVAQICINEHVTNSSTKEYPQHDEKFCERCGSETIKHCTYCENEIRGYYHVDGVFGGSFDTPNHCLECGKPYPWTESKIQSAKEVIELLTLSEENKTTLKNSIEDIVVDTPKTETSCMKFKLITSSLTDEIKDIIKKTFVDIVTDKSKELLWNIQPS